MDDLEKALKEYRAAKEKLAKLLGMDGATDAELMAATKAYEQGKQEKPGSKAKQA